jgi:DNA-binding IscR family transcriptional regulator
LAVSFLPILSKVGEIGQAVLRFMASHGEGTVVSLQALEAETQFATELEKTLALLVQRELVEAEGDGYRFQVEMIRRHRCSGFFQQTDL